MKDILSNKKIAIHLDNVRPINVPYYTGLSVERILDFAGKYAHVQNAFPERKEVMKFERSFICNVIHSLVGEDFQQWIDEKV